jgi:hypothetical protein
MAILGGGPGTFLYPILVKQEGDFSIDFAGENVCVDGRFYCRKVTDECDNPTRDSVPQPPDSPDLIPCDLWLFGILKLKINDRLFDAFWLFHEIWDELTLEDLWSVFFN